MPYDMKKDGKMERKEPKMKPYMEKPGKQYDGVPMTKTASMEEGEQTSGGNESYVLGAAGKVGLYLKDRGRGKGY